LHDRFARPRYSRPPRFRFGILLQPSDFVPAEREVNFSQLALASLPNGIMLCTQLEHVGILDEGLPPDLN
jgi:hypothetical protein